MSLAWLAEVERRPQSNNHAIGRQLHFVGGSRKCFLQPPREFLQLLPKRIPNLFFYSDQRYWQLS